MEGGFVLIKASHAAIHRLLVIAPQISYTVGLSSNTYHYG